MLFLRAFMTRGASTLTAPPEVGPSFARVGFGAARRFPGRVSWREPSLGSFVRSEHPYGHGCIRVVAASSDSGSAHTCRAQPKDDSHTLAEELLPMGSKKMRHIADELWSHRADSIDDKAERAGKRGVSDDRCGSRQTLIAGVWRGQRDVDLPLGRIHTPGKWHQSFPQ